ncbi:MFS transporter [Deinococcus sp. UYEF24]
MWVLALIATAGYGALYYAQPLLAVATEHATGLSRAQTSLAFTLALLTNAALAPLVGRWLDQLGGRVLISGGALLGAGALTALSVAHSYPVFVVSWLLIGAAMTLTFYEAVFTVLGQQRQGPDRVRATLTVTLIAGLASTIFVPLTTAFLGVGGLPLALRGLAGTLLVVAVLGWVVLPSGGHPRARTVLAPFRPDQTFVRLTVVFTLARIVSVGVGLQLAPLFLSRGAAPVVAAALAGAMGLASLPGRMLFVPLLGRLGLQTLTYGLLALLGFGALLLNLPGHGIGAVVGVMAFGLANGALTLARTELLMERYPAAQFGTVNGRMALPVNLAQALTPFAVGLMFTWAGSYRPSLLLLCALALGATWLLWTENRGRKTINLDGQAITDLKNGEPVDFPS